MTSAPDRLPAPDLGPGDVYVYAHANGAISVLDDGGHLALAPLRVAVAAAEGACAAGARVRAGWDDAPLARDAIEAIRAGGIELDVVPDAPAPRRWDNGTTALMEAAASGDDALLDDLIERGADVAHRDDAGATALHHAAARDNVHAVDALVRAGLDPDDRNGNGFTSFRLATATRSLATAQRLADLGADTSAGAAERRAFTRSHLGAVYVWLAIPLLGLVAAGLVAVVASPLTGLAIAVLLLGLAAATAPPRAFWAGGAPRRLVGTTLTLQGLTGTREVDLREVEVAAVGGGKRRGAAFGARWLLLGHADGHRVDERTLARLQVPEGDRVAFADRASLVIVVPLAGGVDHEALVAIGDVLSGLGVDLSSLLRSQLARARADARSR